MYEERRKYPRVSVLQVTIPEGDNVSHEVIQNVSQGGLMIQTSEPWKVGTVLDMVIHATARLKVKAGEVAFSRGE